MQIAKAVEDGCTQHARGSRIRSQDRTWSVFWSTVANASASTLRETYDGKVERTLQATTLGWASTFFASNPMTWSPSRQVARLSAT